MLISPHFFWDARFGAGGSISASDSIGVGGFVAGSESTGFASHFLAFSAESAAAVSACFLLDPSPEPSSLPSQITFATKSF